MIDITEKVFRTGKSPVGVGLRVDVVDVRSMGESLPSYVSGRAVFRIEVEHWPDFVAALQCLAPEVTEIELRRVLRARGDGVLDQVLR